MLYSLGALSERETGANMSLLDGCLTGELQSAEDTRCCIEPRSSG